jgi:hypothetical protein
MVPSVAPREDPGPHGVPGLESLDGSDPGPRRARRVLGRSCPKLERALGPTPGRSLGRAMRVPDLDHLDVMQRGVPGLDGLLVHHEDSRSPGPRQAHRWSPTTRMLLVRTYASTCRADHQREILATGVAIRHPSSCAGANKRCRVVPRWQSSVLAPHKTGMARDGEQGKVHVSTTWVLLTRGCWS